MKNLLKLTICVLALLGANKVNAQTTTNISLRWTVTVLTNGVQQTSTNYNLNLTQGGSNKDTARVNGIAFAYASYVASLGTNSPVALGDWLKNNDIVLLDNYNSQKQASDNAATLVKITSLLTVNADLLSAADLNNLSTIAAKAP